MEFVLGGTAAAAAGFFTNPLDVVKVRFQLQGELKARGLYAVHYKNLFHAFFQIVKHDGFLALQKGLLPASCHQVVLNGIRLGLYQVAEERGWTISPDGNVYIINSIGVGIVAGGMGAFLGSPILLVSNNHKLHYLLKISLLFIHVFLFFSFMTFFSNGSSKRGFYPPGTWPNSSSFHITSSSPNGPQFLVNA
uniref:Solute carrier family 25 member 35 n=1 Tax=Cacopsylla melanoneura TaxID=428564 RepID=A0A8D9F3A0_9HEMI